MKEMRLQLLWGVDGEGIVGAIPLAALLKDQLHLL